METSKGKIGEQHHSESDDIAAPVLSNITSPGSGDCSGLHAESEALEDGHGNGASQDTRALLSDHDGVSARHPDARSERSAGDSSAASSGDAEDGSEDDSDNDSVRSSEEPWKATEYPPLELSYEALKHVANYCLPGNHGKCVEITTIGRGTYHEIRILHFEDEWTCIGRFTRDKNEHAVVIESESATMEYVRKHTSIPVPAAYYVNLDPTSSVGAPFVLMEHMEGFHLYKIWPALKTEFRLSVVSQIADIIAQLSRLRFDSIGSLKLGGTVGPLQNMTVPDHEPGRGPFSTTEDYLMSFIKDDASHQAEVTVMYPDIRGELQAFLRNQGDNAALQAPYRLIHGDFDAQNMLFTWESPTQPPRLSGIIDWDFSYTGPLYYLFEYPVFIQDSDLDQSLYTENKVLRKEFVRMLAQQFPKGSQERHNVRKCFRQKNNTLNRFKNVFASHRWSDPKTELWLVKDYLESFSGSADEHRAYGGRHDWEPDSELESDDKGDGTKEVDDG